ncbi:hypothetical protein C8F04DRAFT_1186445 [Mycena alexandri]|uniref:Uncharacterized protein n=1 Tax=Mycena alexandri TaxID=1745969 RepID=A0AAD6X3G2_9AGAR|nr:hypothetical protein C8F04DRAFT_1186445 [Mycena alexandri]
MSIEVTLGLQVNCKWDRGEIAAEQLGKRDKCRYDGRLDVVTKIVTTKYSSDILTGTETAIVSLQLSGAYRLPRVLFSRRCADTNLTVKAKKKSQYSRSKTPTRNRARVFHKTRIRVDGRGDLLAEHGRRRGGDVGPRTRTRGYPDILFAVLNSHVEAKWSCNIDVEAKKSEASMEANEKHVLRASSIDEAVYIQFESASSIYGPLRLALG